MCISLETTKTNKQRVLQSRVSAGTIGGTSSIRGKEIALIDMSIRGGFAPAMGPHWQFLVISSSLQLLTDLMFHLLTNKKLMKCIQMKYMEALASGRTKSVTCGRD